MTRTRKQTCKRILYGHLVDRKIPLFVATLLAMGLASLPLAAQETPGVGRGERTATFVGQMTAPAKSVAVESPRQQSVKPFLPTMDFGEYMNLKAAANASAATATLSNRGAAPGSDSAVVLNFDFNGTDRFGSADQGFIYTPPDINSAAGQGQIVEVTNDHYTCFDTTGTILQDTPMSVFFSYTGQLLTDPRVVYDHVWNRWIVTEVAFAQSPTVQFFFLAASTSSDCTGSFNVYSINMPLAAGDFYDYPAVGFDQDAIITTFNVFNGPFKYAEVDMAPKARVYNGLGFGMPFINGLPGTLTPNIVRDNNDSTILINNQVGTTNVRLFRLANTSRSGPSITGPFTVNTGSLCNVPASAQQPGTTARLDTLDSRFQAPGTQLGASLYNTQTCGPGLPTPRILQVDINANTLTRVDFVFASGATSWDFNPSVNVSDSGHAVVNWSSTDPTNGINATALFSGKLAGGNFGPLGQCTASGTFSAAFRWGDTSGAAVDPTDPLGRTFVLSNEWIEDASNWGTHICSVTMP